MEELPSVDYKSVSAEFSDHDIDFASALDKSALVRGQHPIRLPCFRRGALPEFPTLSITGTTSFTCACSSIRAGSIFLPLSPCALFASDTDK